MIKSVSNVAVLITMVASPVAAQESTAPNDPPPNAMEGKPVLVEDVRLAGISFLSEQYSISKDEARTRLEVQSLADEFLTDSGILNDPGFSAVYIEHEPKFELVVTFTDNNTRKAFRDSAPAEIKKFLKIKKAKRTEAEIGAARIAIASFLSELKVPTSMTYNPINERFTVFASERKILNDLRKSLPKDLATDVNFRVSKGEGQLQNGFIEGGDTLHTNTTGYGDG